MKLRFHKYHGTGNDFILMDNREGNIQLSEEKIAGLCNRHLGIGADGLICLNSADGFDFGMVYYNADGKESTLCGNGGRCIVAFAHSLGLIENRATFTAIDGKHEAEILSQSGTEVQIKIKMSDIPKSGIRHLASGIHIDTGSPHLVMFVDDISAVDVVAKGRKIHDDKQFAPDGTNVDFVQMNEYHLFVRTYERGVADETLSCGTGVTAAALAYASWQPADRSPQSPFSSYNIQTLGGNLTVSFYQHEGTFTDIWLEGPAEFVFAGEIDR
ncbi:MAG: diaminopimelate epimerase [Bacteroidales bacterium]|nr:diaminopimelate epimerase [Bacteroidota bacterium]MBL6949942.1 diaminopimelate epimerase [Bacteroidales bacterium]